MTDPTDVPCEICGQSGAYKVQYCVLFGVLVFWYHHITKQHVHCKRHILWRAIAAYLITAPFGWLGLSIFLYPIALFQSARAFTPFMGKSAYILMALPCLAVLAFLGRFWNWY